LHDRAGRGRKPWLPQAAVQQVVEQAVTPPAHLGRWSCRTMARAAGISPASVQRLWASVGALNQCFLMGSDYFLVSTAPDYYCNQAISSLSRVLPRWNRSVEQFRNPSLLYPFPKSPPRFCGIISQRYRPRGGTPAFSFQQWIDRIKELSILN
jgi:hypothetical protein